MCLLGFVNNNLHLLILHTKPGGHTEMKTNSSFLNQAWSAYQIIIIIQIQIKDEYHLIMH